MITETFTAKAPGQLIKYGAQIKAHISLFPSTFSTPPPPLDPPRHISCQFLTLFYFGAALGCSAAGVELNNEWMLSECPTAVEKVCSTLDTSSIHPHTCTQRHPQQLLQSLLDVLGRKRRVNWSLERCEMRVS